MEYTFYGGEYFAFTVTGGGCESAKSAPVCINNRASEDILLGISAKNYFGTNDTITVDAYNLSYSGKVLIFAIPFSDFESDGSYGDICKSIFDKEYNTSGKYYDNEYKTYMTSPYYTGISANISPNKSITIKTTLDQYASSILVAYIVNSNPKAEVKGEFVCYPDSNNTHDVIFFYASFPFMRFNGEEYLAGVCFKVDIYSGEKTMTVVCSNVMVGYKITLYNSVTGASKSVTSTERYVTFTGLKYSQGFDSICISHSTLPNFKHLPLKNGYFSFSPYYGSEYIEKY